MSFNFAPSSSFIACSASSIRIALGVATKFVERRMRVAREEMTLHLAYYRMGVLRLMQTSPAAPRRAQMGEGEQHGSLHGWPYACTIN